MARSATGKLSEASGPDTLQSSVGKGSGPRLPNDLITTADEIYVRFHGVKQWYRYNYSRVELEEWAEKIRASGAKRVWAYFNNDRGGYAISNAKTLRKMLQD